MAHSAVGFTGPVVFTGLVLERMEERWRRFLQELASTRRADYEDLRLRLGIDQHKVWLVRVRRTNLALMYLACAEPGTIVARFSASTEPFDRWLKARLVEFHGCDLTRPDPRWSLELVFDSGRPEPGR